MDISEIPAYKEAIGQLFRRARFVEAVVHPGSTIPLGYTYPGQQLLRVTCMRFASPTESEVVVQEYALKDDEQPFSVCKELTLVVGDQVLFVEVSYTYGKSIRFVIFPIKGAKPHDYAMFVNWRNAYKAISRVKACGVTSDVDRACRSISVNYMWHGYRLLRELELHCNEDDDALVQALETLLAGPNKELIAQLPVLRTIGERHGFKIAQIAMVLYDAKRAARATPELVCVAAVWPDRSLVKLHRKDWGGDAWEPIEPELIEPDPAGSPCSFVYISATSCVVRAKYSDGTMFITELSSGEFQRCLNEERVFEHMLRARFYSQDLMRLADVAARSAGLRNAWLAFCIARGMVAAQGDEAANLLRQLTVLAAEVPVEVWKFLVGYPGIIEETPPDKLYLAIRGAAELVGELELRPRLQAPQEPEAVVADVPEDDTPPSSPADLSADEWLRQTKDAVKKGAIGDGAGDDPRLRHARGRNRRGVW